MNCLNYVNIIYFIVVMLKCIEMQRTVLDDQFEKIYRTFRVIGLNFFGRSSELSSNIKHIRRIGKTQNKDTQSVEFCDTLRGPGIRSSRPPTSVHLLRPGDIDIIGAMGDSLTAGNGVFAANLLQVTVENRGLSWSIGGQGNWKEYLTLPNILKEFNPNLYGYSLGDGFSTDHSSKFNVAELGAMSRDLPYEAKVLFNRLKNDPKVNMTNHWKIVTILIGNNDFCSDMCYYTNPEKVLNMHERDMLKTLRYLKNHIPRLMVNIVPPPNLRLLSKMTGLPPECETTLRFECPCLIGKKKAEMDYYEGIILKWIALDYKVANRAEFNTETFTVNIQPFTKINELPKTSKGLTDFKILSTDCFHLSQRGHAFSANALWNNMLERENEKSIGLVENYKIFKCPTTERPFLATRSNSNYPDYKLTVDYD